MHDPGGVRDLERLARASSQQSRATVSAGRAPRSRTSSDTGVPSTYCITTYGVGPVGPGCLAVVVDLHDAGVLEGAREAGLGLQPGARHVVDLVARVEELDRDVRSSRVSWAR